MTADRHERRASVGIVPRRRRRRRATVCLAVLLAPFVARSELAEVSRPPNIVILYADDMGYGDLAIQNPDSKIPTPHLDQLAREGMRFTDAHSSSGVCTPSRYALLTGRYHWRKFHGIVDTFDPPAIDPEEFTLPDMLRRQGYRTAAIGKWHLGWDWDAIKRPGVESMPKAGYPPDAFDWSRRIPGGPVDHGFDYYFGEDVPNFPPYTWFENDRVLVAPSEPLNTTQEAAEGILETRPGPMANDWDFYAVMPRLTEVAIDWIARQRDEAAPFFLYFSFTSPHAPIVPTPDFVGASKAGGYGDFMAQTDWTVGQVLRALDEQGLRENTIVIFASDNGPEEYAYERIRRYGHHSSGPLRGLKRDVWEGGHRVPLIIRWPGRVPADRVSDALISQVDIMATLATVAGAELPAGTAEDSHDLLPVWTEGAHSPRQWIVHNTRPETYAMRHDQWVLIAGKSGGVNPAPAWYLAQSGYAPNDQPGELYDLGRDLGQRNNLYSQHPDKVAELRSLLAKIRARGEVR